MSIKEQVGEWYKILDPIFRTEYFRKLTDQHRQNITNRIVYPKRGKTFRAFQMCPLESVKVVILGQDPYHDGSATGLAFANDRVGRISPSLRNIIQTVKNDFGDIIVNPNLESWAKQGVLLLNTALTVEKGKAGSHVNMWMPFTRDIITSLSVYKPDLIWVLWGKKAQDYEKHIMYPSGHTILKAAHPAAESYSGGKAGFFTCGHFKKINDKLEEPIEWGVKQQMTIQI